MLIVKYVISGNLFYTLDLLNKIAREKKESSNKPTGIVQEA